jgi:hypothetical protein
MLNKVAYRFIVTRTIECSIIIRKRRGLDRSVHPTTTTYTQVYTRLGSTRFYRRTIKCLWRCNRPFSPEFRSRSDRPWYPFDGPRLLAREDMDCKLSPYWLVGQILET